MQTVQRLLPGLILSLFGASVSVAGTITPISLSGFNADVVAEAGSTLPSDTNAVLDSGNRVFYGVGFDSAAPATGLPSGLLTSLSNVNAQFEFAPFNQNNDLRLSDSTGTLTLNTPGTYSELAIFGFSSGSNGASVSYTLTFADASTQSGSLSLDDWFSSAANKAVIAGGRVMRNNGMFDSVGSGFPAVFEYDLPVMDPGSNLISMTFTESVPNSFISTSIMAVSGQVVTPEPATTVLLAMGTGLIGLFSRRGRVRAAH